MKYEFINLDKEALAEILIEFEKHCGIHTLSETQKTRKLIFKTEYFVKTILSNIFSEESMKLKSKYPGSLYSDILFDKKISRIELQPLKSFSLVSNNKITNFATTFIWTKNKKQKQEHSGSFFKNIFVKSLLLILAIFGAFFLGGESKNDVKLLNAYSNLEKDTNFNYKNIDGKIKFTSENKTLESRLNKFVESETFINELNKHKYKQDLRIITNKNILSVSIPSILNDGYTNYEDLINKWSDELSKVLFLIWVHNQISYLCDMV